MEELSNSINPLTPIKKEKDVLQEVIESLSNLDTESRRKLIKTVITFFDLDLHSNDHLVGVIQPQRIKDSKPTREPRFGDHLDKTPKEFLMEKNPLTDVDRAVCLAYYLSHYRETIHFKTQDITNLNTEAAQRKFTNATYVVNNATQSGFLVQAPLGMKQLSAMGEQYVEALPDKSQAKEAIARMRPRRYNKKKTSTSSKTD
ncbi:MAG: hypothetical protein ABSE00_08835 [Chitinispirillaceae bacterium]|jgi:hypothetical protein